MDLKQILATIDAEIEHLQKAKQLLLAETGAGKRRGKATSFGSAQAKPRKKRVLSPEAIERIRAAQKRRWAKAKRKKASR